MAEVWRLITVLAHKQFPTESNRARNSPWVSRYESIQHCIVKLRLWCRANHCEYGYNKNFLYSRFLPQIKFPFKSKFGKKKVAEKVDGPFNTIDGLSVMFPLKSPATYICNDLMYQWRRSIFLRTNLDPSPPNFFYPNNVSNELYLAIKYQKFH